MDTKTFYGARPHTFLALMPENPQDFDAGLSDDNDQIDDPDYQPTQAEESRDTSFDSMDGGEAATAHSSSTTVEEKKRVKHPKNSLFGRASRHPWP